MRESLSELILGNIFYTANVFEVYDQSKQLNSTGWKKISEKKKLIAFSAHEKKKMLQLIPSDWFYYINTTRIPI